jgi:2-polyprenyl-6-methoxyphenol hydroxylase-like FAD-dependent oxidoreductase
MPVRCDVAVVGGNPAGSTVAAFLARAGLALVCFERARFPRFHAGESLLPASPPLVERLGVREPMASAGRVGVVLHQRAPRPLWPRARLECARLSVRRAGRLGRRRGRPVESQRPW